MDFQDVVELSPLLCLGPLFVLGAILTVVLLTEWGWHMVLRFFQVKKIQVEIRGLELQNVRAELDLPLVPVQNGLHKMPVSRAMLVDGEMAAELVARSIETTRAKPLDQLQHLNYAPRIAGADAQANADMSDAMSAIDGLLDATGGELDMHMGANGNGKH